MPGIHSQFRLKVFVVFTVCKNYVLAKVQLLGERAAFGCKKVDFLGSLLAKKQLEDINTC
jgi:hypothetical protein